MILAIITIGVALLAAAYATYGRFLDRRLEIDPRRPTPACQRGDGVDFLATRPGVLLGHHFSSIAGAGPIVGPVIAAAAFGWLPAVIWVVVGSVLIGGVQDYTALVASVRHNASSVAEMARDEISPFARTLFLIFVWFALVYVIVVFVDLTAATFTHAPAVASASAAYIGLALMLGLLVYRAGVGLGRASALFVPAVFVVIWLADKAPLTLPVDDPARMWSYLLLGYCLVASALPVWVLLQPRDYLSSFLLYGCLVGGVVGVLVGGGHVPDGVTPLPAIVTFRDANLGLLFPAMFITIACGACSGFHAVVSSGTTARQLASEGDARPVAYGSMLLEAVLALLAIATVLLVGQAAARTQAPTVIFARGLGHILGALGVPESLGAHFGALAISTFLLTTLDTCTRLARYTTEALLGLPPGRWWAVIGATLLTLLVPIILTQTTLHLPDGTPAPAWKVVWPVFGATNQLLGALAMLTITIWLRNTGRRFLFVAIPMVLMFTVTLAALVQLVLRFGPASLVGSVAAGLLILAVILLVEALRHVLSAPGGPHRVDVD